MTGAHLARTAYLYVRQSTLRQVLTNTESATRQYALRQRAIALGWPAEQVVTIDCDQGQSGASAADREGFQRLVAEVGMGRAGIVLGLEVSRLARNNADWHRLLEICALSGTLICDEDGLYDPGEFNDRLLLGLKGTMSEAELHFIRARLRGGQLSKARRGELKMPLPVGLVYDPADRVVLDPDASVRDAISHLFTVFARTGSARAVVQDFARDGLLFPVRIRKGARKGELTWTSLGHWQVLRALHNPRYAGAFAYGRRREARTPDGKKTFLTVPREQWTALFTDAHPGYLTWEQFEANQQLLLANAAAHGQERDRGPAREGSALLQGLAICGRCGRRITVRYHVRRGIQIPDYECVRACIDTGGPRCLTVPGAAVDTAVGQLLLDTVTPLALDVALSVQTELETRADEADTLRRRHVERTRQHADLARRRYLAVDPNNRLVADSLEADWNDALRALRAAEDDYDTAAAKAAETLSEQNKARIRSLATDFPALWSDPATPPRERKRMTRLVIEDITLAKTDQIHLHVRFRGGTTTSLTVPIPPHRMAGPPDRPRHHRPARPASRRPHRRADRAPAQPGRPPLRRRTPVHQDHRGPRAAQVPAAKSRPTTTRPRPAHPNRNRRPARRPPHHNQGLAPRRIPRRTPSKRQERTALRTTDARRPPPRQTPRQPPPTASPDRTRPRRCSVKPQPSPSAHAADYATPQCRHQRTRHRSWP